MARRTRSDWIAGYIGVSATDSVYAGEGASATFLSLPKSLALGVQAIELEKEVVDGQDFDTVEAGFLCITFQRTGAHDGAGGGRRLFRHADREAV